jgi:hypothetical protein
LLIRRPELLARGSFEKPCAKRRSGVRPVDDRRRALSSGSRRCLGFGGSELERPRHRHGRQIVTSTLFTLLVPRRSAPFANRATKRRRSRPPSAASPDSPAIAAELPSRHPWAPRRRINNRWTASGFTYLLIQLPAVTALLEMLCED